MINAAGREIPDHLLKEYGKTGYQGMIFVMMRPIRRRPPQ